MALSLLSTPARAASLQCRSQRTGLSRSCIAPKALLPAHPAAAAAATLPRQQLRPQAAAQHGAWLHSRHYSRSAVTNSSSSSKAGDRPRSGVVAAASAAKKPAMVDTRRDFDGRFGNGSDALIPKEVLADLSEEERNTVALFQAASPSVVNISTSTSAINLFPLNLFQIPRGVGSGFIWDKEGHVVTNAHVVAGASAVKVTLSDSSVYDAKVIGKDREKDVAVLQLAVPRQVAQQLTPVVLGSSSNLLVGQKVMAIGNPFGLDQTLTQGVVSGLGRELPAYGNRSIITNVIQTDAAINPGNSGGVLLDSKGRLVGINTAILDPSGNGQFSGVGFAIPIDSAKGLVTQILQYGRIMRPYLGVSLAPATLMSSLGVKGVLVLDVAPNGPAARAGLTGTRRLPPFGQVEWGDIIVSMDGSPVTNERDLFSCLDEHRPGQTVELVVQRGAGPKAERRSVRVTLAERRDPSGE